MVARYYTLMNALLRYRLFVHRETMAPLFPSFVLGRCESGLAESTLRKEKS